MYRRYQNRVNLREPRTALTCSIATRYREGSPKASALCRYFGDLTSERMRLGNTSQQSHGQSNNVCFTISERILQTRHRVVEQSWIS